MATTTFLLIRHGAHVMGFDRIAGRQPVQLSPLGIQQAKQMAERIGHLPVRAIYSSPVLRARQTAQALNDRTGLPIELRDPLAEVDFGEWTNRTIDELRRIGGWRQWNEFRAGTRIPNGETMFEIQQRFITEMLRLREQHPGHCVALVTRGDPIRSAIAYWLGMPLDFMLRFEISLASVSVVTVGDNGPFVMSVNSTQRVMLPGEL